MTFSPRRLFWPLVLLASAVGLCGLLGIQYTNVRQLDSDAHAFARQIELLRNAFGYGGFIHHFKNFLLRRTQASYALAGAGLDSLGVTAAELEQFTHDLAEREALHEIGRVIGRYRTAWQLAGLPTHREMQPEALDGLVRVEDTVAISALGILEAAAQQRLAQARAASTQLQMLLAASLVALPLLALVYLHQQRALRRESRLADCLAHSERELRQSNEQMRAIFDGMVHLICLLRPDGTLIELNRSAALFAGQARDTLLGLPLASLPWWPRSPDAQAAVQRALAVAGSGQCFREEFPVLGPGGFRATLDVSLQPLRDEHGEIVRLVLEARDLSERQRLEAGIRAEGERARRYLDIARSIILARSIDGRIQLINREGCELIGLPAGQLIGRNWFETCVPQGERTRAQVVFAQVITGFDPLIEEERALLTASGETRCIAWRHTVVCNETGVVVAILSAGRDVSTERAAEIHLRSINVELERRVRERTRALEDARDALLGRQHRLGILKTLAEQAGSAADLSVVLNLTLRLVCEHLAWPVGHAWIRDAVDQPLRSSHCWHLGDPEIYAGFQARSQALEFGPGVGVIGRVLEAGEAQWIEDLATDVHFLRHDPLVRSGLCGGGFCPVRVRGEVRLLLEFFSTDDNGVTGEIRDFVHQVATLLGMIAETLLDRAELRRLALFASETDDMLVVTDREGRIEWVNQGFSDCTGWTCAEALGQHPGHLIYGPRTDAGTIAGMQAAMRAGDKIGTELVVYRRSGEPFWVALTVQPVYDAAGRLERYLSVAHDISQRHQADELLRSREQELRSLFENVIDGIITMDAKGRVRAFNPAAERLFGYEAAEVIGHNVSMLMPEPHRSAHDGYLARYVAGGRAAIIGIGREVEGLHRDGRRLEIDLAVNECELNGERCFIGIVRDIAERRRITAELERARDAAEQANRAKSTFLATMSHEIRTPMNGVIGMLDVLGHETLTPAQTDTVATIRQSAHTLLSIIDDVLDFSKIEAGHLALEHAPLPLAAIIESIGDTLAPIAASKQVTLEIYVDPRLPEWILGDAVRLRQVLYNLAGNAVKFTGEQTDRPGCVALRAECGTAGGLRLRVIDTGIGMSAQTIERLFQPFMQAEASTTRRFGGTGLGLSIVARLIDLMGGRIGVDSTPGLGSTFTIELPLEAAGGQPSIAPRYAFAGLPVSLLCGGDRLGADLGEYLAAAGARVLPAADVDTLVQDSAAAGDARLAIVVVDGRCHGADSIERLRGQFAAQAGRRDVRYVLITHGRRRESRIEGDDLITLDGNVLHRHVFLRAVAIAAGLASPVTPAVETMLPLPAAAPPGIEAARTAGRLILVAEDNAINRKVLERQLALLGHAAEFVADGRAALSRWRSHRHALLITDLHMPELDGYELAATIRHEESASGSRRRPIIAFTANALKGEVEHCRSVGMDDCLIKPLQIERLRTALERWLPVASVPAAAAPVPEAPPPRSGERPPPFDPLALQELIGDDAELITGLLDEFLDGVRANLDALRQLQADQDLTGIADIGHRLKSSARAVGAAELGMLYEQLEQAGRADDGPAIDAVLAALAPAIARLTARIEPHAWNPCT